jgi:hypothetical protein
VIGVFVYHECTMRQHAEMGDVLTGKLIKYYFTYIRTPQTANFQEEKNGIYTYSVRVSHFANILIHLKSHFLINIALS